jgi:hypothetical protein
VLRKPKEGCRCIRSQRGSSMQDGGKVVCLDHLVKRMVFLYLRHYVERDIGNFVSDSGRKGLLGLVCLFLSTDGGNNLVAPGKRSD